MKSLYHLSLWLVFAASLTSCDRVKQGLLTVVKEGASKAVGTLSSGVPFQVLGEAEHESFIQTTEEVAVVVYHSDACPACAQLDPVLQKVVSSVGGPVKLGKVDVKAQPQFAIESDVHGIPDVRFYINGVEVDRFVGAEEEALVRQKLEAQVARVESGDLPQPKPKEVPPDQMPDKPVAQPMSKDWMPPGMQRR